MVFAMVLWFSECEQLTNIHFTFTFSDPDLLVVRVFGCAHPQITKTDGRLHACIG